MEQSTYNKLLSCKTYADAKAILETVSVPSSVYELAHTAFSIRPTQKALAESFMKTVANDVDSVIKETEGSHGSSSTTGLEKVGTEQNAAENAESQPNKKDQMGVAINETFPLGDMGQQMPPQQPQMNPQQQQFMRYTISEVAKALSPQLKSITEAIKTLDSQVKAVKETQANAQSLDLGNQPQKLSVIRETSNDIEVTRRQIRDMNKAINSQSPFIQ